jgi:predicted nucleic acid-binding protein
MARLLVDTSVWIRLLRGDRVVRDRLATAVGQGDDLVTCGPIQLELLAGRTARNADAVDSVVHGTRPLPVDPREDFLAAGELAARARAAGHPVRSSIDCLIAQVALRNGDVTVVHADRDFTHLAEVSGLVQQAWAGTDPDS